MFNKNNNNNNFSHLCRDWWSARLCQRRACAGRLVFTSSRRPLADCVHGGNRLCSRRPLVPTVFTAASCRLCSRRQPADCVRGGLLCRLCSRRRLADCVHGGNQPHCDRGGLLCRLCSRRPLADRVHGGNQPIVFVADSIRLCAFTADSCRLCSWRQPADCVRGGLLCRLCSRRPLADCVHGGRPLHWHRRRQVPRINAATLCVVVLVEKRPSGAVPV